MGWAKKLRDKGGMVSLFSLYQAYPHMLSWGAKHDSESTLPKLWEENSRINLDYLKTLDPPAQSIHGIPEYISHAAVFIGRGDSLMKAMKMFEDVDSKHFITVATNSTIRILLEHGIVPTYMIAVDGNPGHWSLKDLPSGAEKVTGIFSTFVQPEALKAWPGVVTILPLGSKDPRTKRQIINTYGPPLMAGGNSINTAVATFLFKTQIRILLFVGCNLSFKKRFYVDQDTKADGQVAFPATDIYGEEVLTNIPMWQYKMWLEQMASQFYPDWMFYNCSEGILGTLPGGGHMEEFRYMPLDMAVKEVREALTVERNNGGFIRMGVVKVNRRGKDAKLAITNFPGDIDVPGSV